MRRGYWSKSAREGLPRIRAMSLQLWLLYVSVLLAVIVTPGPSAILCMSHGAAHGARRALATIGGGMCASLILMGLSALGLGAAIAASDALFNAIRLAGAAYLVWLGISTWRAAPQAFGQLPAEGGRPAREGRMPLFRKGFLVGIGNPKDLLFFGALFPQFIDPNRPVAPQLAVLAATWLVVDGLTMFAYARFGAAISRRLRSSRAGQLFNRVTGGAFMAAGGALAVAHR